MAQDQKSSKFGLGLLFGMLMGVLGGIFMAPKSGKETREELNKKVGEWKEAMDKGELETKVKEVFGSVSEESKKMYMQAREEIITRFEQVKQMDGDDYARMVDEVMAKVKEGAKMSSDKMSDMKKHFVKEMPEVRKEAEKRTKRATKRTVN